LTKYAVVTIAPDGATDVHGPFTSESRARLYACRLEAKINGLAADVYQMGTPRELAAWSRGESQDDSR
jgi:hypothetical protein